MKHAAPSRRTRICSVCSFAQCGQPHLVVGSTRGEPPARPGQAIGAGPGSSRRRSPAAELPRRPVRFRLRTVAGRGGKMAFVGMGGDTRVSSISAFAGRPRATSFQVRPRQQRRRIEHDVVGFPDFSRRGIRTAGSNRKGLSSVTVFRADQRPARRSPIFGSLARPFGQAGIWRAESNVGGARKGGPRL
jgi:hypothetical protein